MTEPDLSCAAPPVSSPAAVTAEPTPARSAVSSQLPLVLDLDDALRTALARRAWEEQLPPVEVVRRALRETLLARRPATTVPPSPPGSNSNGTGQISEEPIPAAAPFSSLARTPTDVRRAQIEADIRAYQQFPQERDDDLNNWHAGLQNSGLPRFDFNDDWSAAYDTWMSETARIAQAQATAAPAAAAPAAAPAATTDTKS